VREALQFRDMDFGCTNVGSFTKPFTGAFVPHSEYPKHGLQPINQRFRDAHLYQHLIEKSPKALGRRF
jgi:hypothetical protein